MESEDRVCGTTAQACIKLETALSLYKALENNASEQEKLLLLAALRDVKTLLCDREDEYIKSLQQELVGTVNNFGSHLELIALNRLVHDVELIKRELNNLENGKQRAKKEERKSKQLKNEDVELSDEGKRKPE